MIKLKSLQDESLQIAQNLDFPELVILGGHFGVCEIRVLQILSEEWTCWKHRVMDMKQWNTQPSNGECVILCESRCRSLHKCQLRTDD